MGERDRQRKKAGEGVRGERKKKEVERERVAETKKGRRTKERGMERVRKRE